MPTTIIDFAAAYPAAVEKFKARDVRVPRHWDGMLPAAICAFNKLLAVCDDLNPVVVSGYNAKTDIKDFTHWGCACRVQCKDMAALKKTAEELGITWLSDEGDMAYTNGLTIDDFLTFRVNGSLELVPEEDLKLMPEEEGVK
jgi:hypothetical protein